MRQITTLRETLPRACGPTQVMAESSLNRVANQGNFRRREKRLWS